MKIKTLILLSMISLMFSSCKELGDFITDLANQNTIYYGGQAYTVTKASDQYSNAACTSAGIFGILAENKNGERILIYISGAPKSSQPFEISKLDLVYCKNAGLSVSEFNSSNNIIRSASSIGGGTCSINFSNKNFIITDVVLSNGSGIISGKGNFKN